MKRGCKIVPGRITVIPDQEGESIEEMLRRMQTSGEKIEGGARIEYTDRKDGVHKEHDIRTDRFEVARQATDKINASHFAQRMTEDGYMKDQDGNWVKVPEQPQGEA